MVKIRSGLERALNWGKAAAVSLPLIAGVYGCEKPDDPIINPTKDTTPPKITINSPTEYSVYGTDTISYEGSIVEPNLKNAWYSTDNEQTKIPITGKSWKKNLILPAGDNHLITYADDSAGNYTKEIVNFSILKPIKKPVVNPFIQPNDSTLNWYGSGDVDNNNIRNSQDLDRMVAIINGTYSNPSDKRLYDRADVNGDEIVNSEDVDILSKKLNGTRLYLPGEWNLLMFWAEREDWFKKMLAIDKTNEIPNTPEFDCDEHALQTYINFHGVEPKDITKFFNVYPFDVKDNGRFNIPVYFVALHYYDSENKLLRGHAVDRVVFGNNFLNPQDKCDFETETDAMYVNISKDYGSNDHAVIWIRGDPILEPQDEFGKKYLGLTLYLEYSSKDDNYTLVEQNSEIELITEREK